VAKEEMPWSDLQATKASCPGEPDVRKAVEGTRRDCQRGKDDRSSSGEKGCHSSASRIGVGVKRKELGTALLKSY